MSATLALLVAATAVSCLEQAQALVPPIAGYRYLAPSHVSGRWHYVLEEYGVDGRCVSADINADGRPDFATFLVAPDSGAFVVVVLLSQQDGGYEARTPLPAGAVAGPLEDGILTALPQGHVEDIGCGDRVGGPNQDLSLVTPGFDYLNYAASGPKPRPRPAHWLVQWRDGNLVATNRCLR